MKCVSGISRLLVLILTTLLLATGFIDAAENDDAGIFVKAFEAQQRKDYLLAIEKIEQLNRLFPDSPLRDVVLLLTARSSYNAGDNERAAKAVTVFINDFPESSLRSTIEEELLTLSNRQQQGEKLTPNKKLQEAAQKIRTERLAQERFAAAKIEQERLAKEKSERERRAHEKFETERKARELAAAEKAAKESIKVAVSIQNIEAAIAVGQSGSRPVEIANRGKGTEEFVIDIAAPPEYGAFITPTDNSGATVTRITLTAGQSFKGNLIFRIPDDKVDGNRTALTVKTTSAKYNDIFQQKSTVVIASAPLVRVVAKLSPSSSTAEEMRRYKVTILNIGSMAAQMLTVRLRLPAELDFQGSPEINFNQEPDGSLIFRLNRIDTGTLVEIPLNVKITTNINVTRPLQSQIEVVNGQLQRKDIFTVAVTPLQALQKPL